LTAEPLKWRTRLLKKARQLHCLRRHLHGLLDIYHHREAKNGSELLSAAQELHQMNQILREPASDEGGDDFDAFGQYMVLSLKKLPINMALECQEKIQSLLTSYRLAAVAPQSEPSSSSAPEDPRVPLQFIPTTTNYLALLVSQVMEDKI
jgi:hypothetical protein